MSYNPNITWDIIKDNPAIDWDWHEISEHSNITWDIIRCNPGYSWDWYGISRNPNITWDIIQANPDEPWVWGLISSNPNITWDIIRANPNKPWNKLSYHHYNEFTTQAKLSMAKHHITASRMTNYLARYIHYDLVTVSLEYYY